LRFISYILLLIIVIIDCYIGLRRTAEEVAIKSRTAEEVAIKSRTAEEVAIKSRTAEEVARKISTIGQVDTIDLLFYPDISTFSLPSEHALS
jgi:hypothetical protein